MRLLAAQVGLACLGSTAGASLAAAALGPDARSLLTSIVADWLILVVAGAAIALLRERRPVGSFRHAGTNVNTVLVVVDRPDGRFA